MKDETVIILANTGDGYLVYWYGDVRKARIR